MGRGIAKKLEQNGMFTMGDVALCSERNEDLLYKLFGKNAELLIDHAWGWEPTTIEAIKAYRPSSNSLSSGQVFLFLGANIDAVETASQFGIGADCAVNYQCDSEGTALNYEVVSEAISSVRCSAPLSADWKKRIDEDYKKRGGRKHK